MDRIVVDRNRAAASFLVLGGARSGKSSFAQAQAEATGLAPVFIATAQAYDAEMATRIGLHRAARDDRWRVVEAPIALAEAIETAANPAYILLVDCMTLWLSNIMLRGDDVAMATKALVAVVRRLRGPAIFVSNEVGNGIVPDNALARSFRDAQGRLNQDLAATCTSVVLVTAGLPMCLKPSPGIIFRV